MKELKYALLLASILGVLSTGCNKHSDEDTGDKEITLGYYNLLADTSQRVMYISANVTHIDVKISDNDNDWIIGVAQFYADASNLDDYNRIIYDECPKVTYSDGRVKYIEKYSVSGPWFSATRENWRLVRVTIGENNTPSRRRVDVTFWTPSISMGSGVVIIQDAK